MWMLLLGEPHLVCFLRVVAVRKHGLVLSLVLNASLLQVDLPLSLKVKPLLLVLYMIEMHTYVAYTHKHKLPQMHWQAHTHTHTQIKTHTVIQQTTVTLAFQPTCHVSYCLPAVVFSFWNDLHKVTTPGHQRLALHRVGSEECRAQRPQETCTTVTQRGCPENHALIGPLHHWACSEGAFTLPEDRCEVRLTGVLSGERCVGENVCEEKDSVRDERDRCVFLYPLLYQGRSIASGTPYL